MTRSFAAALATALFLFGQEAFAIAQRTFVSTAGNDANTALNCSLVAPCRSFGSAITVTATDGEIVALESGGYGHVAIGKSVAIRAPAGVYAGISAFFGENGVDVNGAGIVVTLRGLTVNGQGGATGILFTKGSRLYIEQCSVSNMALHGIALLDGETYISDTTVRENALNGIRAEGSIRVAIERARVERNGSAGLRVLNGPEVAVTATAVTGNRSFGVEIDTDDGASDTVVTITESNVSLNVSGCIQAEAAGAGSRIRLAVSRNTLSRSGGSGVDMKADTGTLTASVTDNVIARNSASGIVASGAGASATVASNAVSNNGTGLHQASSASLKTRANNVVQDTGGNLGTLTFVAGD